MRALIAVAVMTAPAFAQPAESPPPAESATPTCRDADIAPRLAELLRAQRYADVHHAAIGARVVCGNAELPATRLLDDIALLRLDDRAWALTDLQAQAAGPRGELANLVLAWAYTADGDDQAATAVMARLPAPRAAAIAALGALGDDDAFAARAAKLPDALATSARQLGERYHDARERSPAFAGVLSAVVPGAGQLYAGSLQAAAVTLVLNGLFVTATVELARNEYYFSAAATGTAASFFYVGGIMNAVDLARRRNQRAQQPHRDALEQLLVPELYGSFTAP